ncbi:uncharacterized protein LOC110109132 isoform X1 [Dendrobium catenatum]|uniref:Uncharacterized protein n=1 Tax=Dendrobium catenatum TaxID=906689 RepID=A0A2I0VQD1_9ASPA|nr:uncharacterized protein LOC110109132 isoform X1 [Dendrobium catenatum]PKU65618.1 hypothetical protein MA16_Dca021507 [Dendrobium catenatum]
MIGRTSIALEEEGIGSGPRCDRTIPCFPACESPAAIGELTASVSRSSSIGRNSDCSLAGGEEGGEAEVQSSYKGPLETMDALEDSLPIRRGISNFYCGKSKSFAVLSDAMAKLSSAKELGKPENPYSRKRKKLLPLTSRWEVGECDRSSGGSKKRQANSSSRIEGAHWASPLVEETDRNSFPVRSFSLMDLEGMESLSSSSSSLSSLGFEEQKIFS